MQVDQMSERELLEELSKAAVFLKAVCAANDVCAECPWRLNCGSEPYAYITEPEKLADDE